MPIHEQVGYATEHMVAKAVLRVIIWTIIVENLALASSVDAHSRAGRVRD